MFTVVMLAFPFGENRVIVSGRGGSTDTENDDCILMQFTGLLDRHGKEIYEGDILKSEGETKTQPFNFNKEVRDPWWEISEVVFEGGRFGQIVRTQHNSYFGELPSPFRDIFRPEEYKEVIGNIYENPSLLKET
jgi:uncharacterized phage protein (TIGR01671 family)